jgi:hypothetical protein
MKRVLLLVTIASMLPLSVAVAQTVNATIVFEGHTIEIEPEKGPVQGCITEVVTTETLDSTTVATKGFIAAFNTDKWIVTGVFTGSPNPGESGSHVEDCFHTAWDN